MTDCASAPRRVLVIDDDPSCRMTFACLLQTLGYTVAEAENGSAGLAILRQQSVDLVMTDLKMPGLTGWDVARLAKALHPHLRVVLVTGDPGAIPLDHTARRHVDALLAKPCGRAEIQAVIGALTLDRADAVGVRAHASGGLGQANTPVRERCRPHCAP
jgi:CheY-like chemotaxis protein